MQVSNVIGSCEMEVGTPLLSIVIANYNYGRFLETAIHSVLSQGMGNAVELIVVDGGSSDNSIEIIRKYAERIFWWCSEPDGGQSAAFNKGFAHARGRFLTWLNADDMFTSGALKAIVKEIKENPKCEWFVGSTMWTNEALRVSKCFCAHRFSEFRAKWGFLSVGGPSSFFTKRLLNAAGGFDENLHYMMDTDLWYRFYRKCGAKYHRTRRNVWVYRQHEASKLSGADRYSTPVALENREKVRCERKILESRYGSWSGLRCGFSQYMGFSILDFATAVLRTLRLRGRYAYEC